MSQKKKTELKLKLFPQVLVISYVSKWMHVVGTKVCVSQFSEQNIINKSSGVLLWKLTLCTNPRRSRSAVPTSLGWLRKVRNHGFKTSCLYNRWFSTTTVLPPITVRLPAQHWLFAFDTKVTKKKKTAIHSNNRQPALISHWIWIIPISDTLKPIMLKAAHEFRTLSRVNVL